MTRPIDTKAARALCDGFAGRFFFDAERGDIGYIEKKCDDRQCSCLPRPNSDGDQDCSISVTDPMDETVGEPMAAMLNLAPALLDRVEALEKALAEACDLAEEGFGYASYDTRQRWGGSDEVADLRALLAKGDGK